jgi:hypothetical protein
MDGVKFAHSAVGSNCLLEAAPVLTVNLLQAVLSAKAGLELPTFLMVAFMPAMHVGIDECNARPRIVCAASAGVILRALIMAGKPKMALCMIEEYLTECAFICNALHVWSSIDME